MKPTTIFPSTKNILKTTPFPIPSTIYLPLIKIFKYFKTFMFIMTYLKWQNIIKIKLKVKYWLMMNWIKTCFWLIKVSHLNWIQDKWISWIINIGPMKSILHRIFRTERLNLVWDIDIKKSRMMYFLASRIWIRILIFKFKNDFNFYMILDYLIV